MEKNLAIERLKKRPVYIDVIISLFGFSVGFFLSLLITDLPIVFSQIINIFAGFLTLILTWIGKVYIELKNAASNVATIKAELLSGYKPKEYSAILDHFQVIKERQDRLFQKEAVKHLDRTLVFLEDLSSSNFTLQGTRVYEVYTELIAQLEEDSEYFASTWISDYFWEDKEGQKFLDANIRAIRSGAKISRIFFYQNQQQLSKYQRILENQYRKKQTLEPNLQTNFDLYVIKNDAVDDLDNLPGDLGIVKDRYLLTLTDDPERKVKRARICNARKKIALDLQDFRSILKNPALKKVEDVLNSSKTK